MLHSRRLVCSVVLKFSLATSYSSVAVSEEVLYVCELEVHLGSAEFVLLLWSMIDFPNF